MTVVPGWMWQTMHWLDGIAISGGEPTLQSALPEAVLTVRRLGFKVGLHQKDLGICADMAAEYGVRLPVVEMTRHHYSRLIEEGHGDEDISSLFRIKSALFQDGGT